MALTKVGIVGGGQLAWLLCEAAKPLGLQTLVYAPACLPKVHQAATQVYQGTFDDDKALAAFAQHCDVVTVETEALPVGLITALDSLSLLRPNRQSLLTAQDRWLEKSLFQALELASNQVRPIESASDLMACRGDLGFPLVVKTRRDGYDGKGQAVLSDQTVLNQWLAQQPVLQDCVAESWVDFDQEISVIAVRSAAGEIKHYDTCINHHRDGILRHTVVEPQHALSQAARHMVTVLAQHLDYIGVLTLECFVTSSGQLLANEMAPRVHNSGHWSIEGTRCSQFENHLRAVTAMPLGETQTVVSCEMFNRIGTFTREIPHPQVHWYDYGKTARPGRKLGHVTVCEDDVDKRQQILKVLGLS